MKFIKYIQKIAKIQIWPIFGVLKPKKRLKIGPMYSPQEYRSIRTLLKNPRPGILKTPYFQLF
jgi:hypothetical protein